jgi:hypothetical protein
VASLTRSRLPPREMDSPDMVLASLFARVRGPAPPRRGPIWNQVPLCLRFSRVEICRDLSPPHNAVRLDDRDNRHTEGDPVPTDLYSTRKKQQTKTNSGSDVYQYDAIPDQVRVQIVQIAAAAVNDERRLCTRPLSHASCMGGDLRHSL